MERLCLHLRKQNGAKTIIKNLKKFDKNLIIREYESLIVVESDNLPHYVSCNTVSSYKNCMVVYDSDNHSKVMTIPLSMIDTIFA